MPCARLFARLLFVSSLIFLSCNNTKYNETDLLGNWKVSTWKNITTNESRSNQMDMHFGNNRAYEVDYGSVKEKGKYWISGDYLHTVEDGKAEKKVKLLILHTDTLSFQMNRYGNLENVVLAKA